MGVLGVARANTSVGASPKTFLLLLLHRVGCAQPSTLTSVYAVYVAAIQSMPTSQICHAASAWDTISLVAYGQRQSHSQLTGQQ
jgi:hypothetical protein